MQSKFVALLVISGALAGCAPLGMVYVHRDTYGVDLSTGREGSAPFQVNLGASNHMATYIPVAVPKDSMAVGSAASHAVAGIAAQAKSQEVLNAMLETVVRGDLIDMFSVYSTFSSRTGGGTNALTVDRGNVFATGVAARQLAATDRARVCLQLEQLAEVNKGDTAKLEAVRKTIGAVCTDK